jgi:hypothetical protein
MTRLAVIGSRTFRDFPMLCRIIPAYKPSLIISGGCPLGADTFAEWWAELTGTDTLIFLPDGKPGGYHRRDRQIAEACDRLLAFWDGRSPGTRYTVNYARLIEKPVHVVRFKR